MALLTSSNITRDGVQADGGAAAGAGGDTFVNTGRELVVFKNADASPKTVTIDILPSGGPGGGTLDGQAVTDKAVVVTNGTTVIMGPFPTSQYNNSAGQVSLSYSAVTSCTVKVLRVGDLG
jgi:hypothetical protein